MDDVLFVDRRQGIHHGVQNLQCLGDRDLAASGLEICQIAFAIHVFHGEVSRAVFLEIAVDPDDVGIADEFCPGPGPGR